jgi:hypothetical protein
VDRLSVAKSDDPTSHPARVSRLVLSTRAASSDGETGRVVPVRVPIAPAISARGKADGQGAVGVDTAARIFQRINSLEYDLAALGSTRQFSSKGPRLVNSPNRS